MALVTSLVIYMEISAVMADNSNRDFEKWSVDCGFCWRSLTIFNLFGAVMPETAAPVDIIGGLDATLHLDFFSILYTGFAALFLFFLKRRKVFFK